MAIEKEDLLYLIAEEYLDEYLERAGLQPEEAIPFDPELINELVNVLIQACDEEFDIFQSTHLEEE